MYGYKKALPFVALFLLSNAIFAKDIKQLNSMTVTAQKIEEKEQDVPISMEALTQIMQ